jgi:hypothetical protein
MCPPKYETQMPLTLLWCSRIDDSTKSFVLIYQTRGYHDFDTTQYEFLLSSFIIMNTWSLNVACLWFEVFIAVLQKNQIFWDVTLCCGIVVCSVFNAHGSFEMSRSITPSTWCSIPQDLDLPDIVSSTKHVQLGLSGYVALVSVCGF